MNPDEVSHEYWTEVSRVGQAHEDRFEVLVHRARRDSDDTICGRPVVGLTRYAGGEPDVSLRHAPCWPTE